MLHQAPKDMAAVKASATIPRDELKRAAALMRGTIERRNTVPILSYLKVEIAPGRVTMSGTDLDIEVSIELEADTEGSATLMISERVFAGFAPGAAGPVTIRAVKAEAKGAAPYADRIHLTDGETSLTLNDHMPAGEYPSLKPNGGATAQPAFKLSQTEVARLLGLGRHCISKEETRYYLNGTFLTKNPETGSVRAVSTNGHILARIDTDEPADLSGVDDDPAAGLIVPRKTVDLILEIVAKGGNEPVEFGCARHFLTLKVGGITLRSKTIDGTFPDYTRVIPPYSDTMVAHLSGHALRRMSHAAKMISGYLRSGAKLDFEAGRISFGSLQSVEEPLCEMPLQCKRAEGCSTASIGFDLRYLRDQGNVTPTFTLSTAGDGHPAMIHSDDPGALWILMPMRL